MARKFSAEPHAPKYRQVFENLSREILSGKSGKYQPGQKFSSEAALVQQFRTSRITIGRALRELTQREWWSESPARALMSGNRARPATGCCLVCWYPTWAKPKSSNRSVEVSRARHRLPGTRCCGVHHDQADSLREAKARETNLTVVSRLEKARIPVLLDRCVMPYPSRSGHDLVGIDNCRAAFMATEHLLRLGAPRVAFLAHAGGAPTVEARVAGFREAVLAAGLKLKRSPAYRVDAVTEGSVLTEGEYPGVSEQGQQG